MADETEDYFKRDYNSLKTSLDNLGYVVDTGNFAKFSKRVNTVDIHVAAHIATQKELYQIGSKYDEASSSYVPNIISDDIYQYQVWAEKNGKTLTSISGAGQGDFDVDSVVSACNSIESSLD